MPRTIKALKGWTRLTPSISRWPLPWTMVAAALVTLWRRRKPVVVAAIALSYVAYLRPGGLATLRVRNLVGPIRPRSTGATGRFSLVIREEESGIPSKSHTFDDSVILDRPDLLWMDRLWRALIAGRPGHALLILVSQNELAHEMKKHFRGARLQQTGNCRIQLNARGALVGLHEKVPQPRRNSATGSLAKLVKRFALPKSFETPPCNAAHRTTTSRVWQVLRRQPRAPPRRPHGRPIFPWTGHRCFIEIGNAAASVSRAVKRRGVLAEIWSSWYGTQQDISVEKTRTLLLKRIRRNTIAGIFLSPPTRTFSKARRGKVDSCWPIAFRDNSCPEGFSWLEGSMREAVSQANIFANPCAYVVLEGIRQGIRVALFHMTGSYMWSLDTYCRLRDLNPTVSLLDWCQFGNRFRRRTTIWSWNLEILTVLPTCYRHGNICSWSEREHQHCKPRPQSARATGTLSIPWRLRDTIASWFLNTWEQNALGYRWSSCRRSIPEYWNSGSIIQ